MLPLLLLSCPWHLYCSDTTRHYSTLLAARLPQYPIIGAYPNAQTDGGYRNAFGDGKDLDDPGFIMTGPACAKKSTLNKCELTKDAELGGGDTGDTGDTGGGGGGGGGDTATPPACSPILYTVQAGDSLTSIANANMDTQQVDWIQICNRNMLSDCDVIEVGQELTIPCDVNLASAQSAEDGGGGGSGGAIAGVVIALLVLGALIALAIWKKKQQPGAAPPPPKQVIVEIGDATA